MFKSHYWVMPVALVLIVPGYAGFCSATDRTQDALTTDSGIYVKVRLSNAFKVSRLKPGDLVEGSLARDVFSQERKLFSSGSVVRLTVDHMETRRRAPNDHWPWVIQAFTPRQETYPVFRSANVVQGKDENSVQVSLISLSRMREVRVAPKKSNSVRASDSQNGAVEVRQSGSKETVTSTLVLEAFGIEKIPPMANEKNGTEPDPARPETLQAGTHCTILLLGDVSASKSKVGDVVRARLLEPVLSNSSVALPAGSLFEGRVVKKTPPRRLSRAGSLYLAFTELTLPGGDHFSIAASLAGAELDASSHTRMDNEGGLLGERPGKAWMAINLGVTGGSAKGVDDGMQLMIEALVSAATDASTAGTARIISSCMSGIYMATRHGRDVVVPRFTEMDISLDRPLALNPAAEAGPSTASAGGK